MVARLPETLMPSMPIITSGHHLYYPRAMVSSYPSTVALEAEARNSEHTLSVA